MTDGMESRATAMDVAKEALNEIRSHTRECDLRYQNIEASNSRIEAALTTQAAEQRLAMSAAATKQSADIGGLYKLMWGLVLAFTGGMFALVLLLAFKH